MKFTLIYLNECIIWSSKPNSLWKFQVIKLSIVLMHHFSMNLNKVFRIWFFWIVTLGKTKFQLIWCKCQDTWIFLNNLFIMLTNWKCHFNQWIWSSFKSNNMIPSNIVIITFHFKLIIENIDFWCTPFNGLFF